MPDPNKRNRAIPADCNDQVHNLKVTRNSASRHLRTALSAAYHLAEELEKELNSTWESDDYNRKIAALRQQLNDIAQRGHEVGAYSNVLNKLVA